MNDEIFKKVENKTKVDKATIIDMAKMVSDNGLKDEKTLRTVIAKFSEMTGKEVSPEMEEKIINTIVEDKVPKDIENMF